MSTTRAQSKLRLRQMVLMAILTAIILVLQLTGFVIKLPFMGTSISLVLIPITLGAMIVGPAAGAFLGFVFGLEVFIVCGVMGTDAFTAFLFQNSPVMTAVICLLKSTLAGFLSGLTFRLIERKNVTGATFAAAVVTPVVNTGLFVLLCLCISGTINGFISENALGVSAVYFLIILCSGFNFIFELILNLILSPALVTLYRVAKRRARF